MSEQDIDKLREQTQRGNRVAEAEKSSDDDFADVIMDVREDLAAGEISKTWSFFDSDLVSVLVAAERMPEAVADIDGVPTPGTDEYTRSKMVKALVRRGLDDADDSLLEATKEAKKREIDQL